MKDISISMKVGESYKSMMNIKQGKYGPQLAFSPDFKKVLITWLKSTDESWLNFNIKEFEPRVQETQQEDAPF